MSTVAENPELLLRQLSAYALDYACLTEDIFGWTPRPWQREVLLHPRANQILATHRQAGKTEVVSALAAATTISPLIPESTSLVVSTGRDHATDIMRRIAIDLKKAQTAGLCEITEQSKHHCVLEDGSRIFSVASTETATRGYSVSGILLIDEAAYIPDTILTSLFPVVAAAGGAISLMSTPNGRTGIFSDVYHSDDTSWLRTTVKSSDIGCCLSDSFLETQKTVLGPSRFSQEFEVSFIDSDQSAFSASTIDGMFSGGEPLNELPEEDPVEHTDMPFVNFPGF